MLAHEPHVLDRTHVSSSVAERERELERNPAYDLLLHARLHITEGGIKPRAAISCS